MEKQIFTWKGWDINDTCAFTFYDVELVRNIPGFLAGTKFDLADVDYEHGTLQLLNYGPVNESSTSLKLGLVIL